MAGVKQSPAAPRRSEILAALSLAIDLGLGQPMEHMLRSCLLALRIAEAAGVDAAAQGRLYYANQVAWIGCHADSFELAALFTDDIAFRADYYNRDQRGLPMYAGMFSHPARPCRRSPALPTGRVSRPRAAPRCGT